jgi:adenylate kinase
MTIIILGPQGSGKGTQAKLLARDFNLFYLESGEFFRKLAKHDARVDEIVNKKGELLPDEEVFAYISTYLDKKDPDGENIILDGYPRSIKQYEFLKDWLKNKNSKIDKAVLLDISERESIKRLSARRICEQCGAKYNLITKPPPADGCECGGKLIQREDDKPEAIRKRLALYKKMTEPLIGVLRKEGILMEVDGERPIKVIFEDIKKRLRVGNAK